MTTRRELIAALQLRYGSATFGDRIRILDEFVALTGYHRKHAIRLLREAPGAVKLTRERNRLYDEAVRQALTGVVGSGRPGLRQATEGVDPEAG
jgi:hypothetical protein